MSWLIELLLAGGLVLLLSAVLPGIKVKNYGHALLAALVLAISLGAANWLLTTWLIAPFNWLTLGLLGVVVSAIVVLVVDKLLSGFEVKGFWWALIFAVLFGLGYGLITRLV